MIPRNRHESANQTLNRFTAEKMNDQLILALGTVLSMGTLTGVFHAAVILSGITKLSVSDEQY